MASAAPRWEVMRSIVAPYTGVGLVGGVMLALGRALGETMAVTFVIGNAHKISRLDPGAGHHDFGDHRQRIHRGRRQALHLLADRAGPGAVRHHLLRAGRLARAAGAHRSSEGRVTHVPRRHAQVRSSIAMGPCVASAGVGLLALALHPGRPALERFFGPEPRPCSRRTRRRRARPAACSTPSSGSLIMTVSASPIGAPLGLFAGTYMAEYGQFSRITSVVRFINDMLLSAPSIVIGLFVYEITVVQMGHFSGLAGALALALLVIPVVVRTTEDMLNLVPGGLREAATALGLPRSLVIRHVAYKAARAGLITGLLLAVARVSGETAPLLFTALNNQFFSTNLNAPMSSLPVVIFQFALSPYKEWQTLAWAGALLITLAVLALSITARVLGAAKGPCNR